MFSSFLHLADIHLGYSKYNNATRTKDFFYALQDAIERYALAEPVDFVLLAGDLFEHRNILPHVLNQAEFCLGLLRERGIPVLSIEGNHDHRPHGTKTSWLRYLADHDYLMLLEPDAGADPAEIFQPWDPEIRRGGYVDLACGVRVVGSSWYGSSAPQAIAALATGLTHLPPAPGATVMLFHHGLEGEIARYTGALREGELLPLREAGVDYLAMGHIHKHYTRGGWIYNPGSLEANSVAENQEQNPRGVYRVTLKGREIEAQLHQDYYQRTILRLGLEVEKTWSQEEVQEKAIALVESYQNRTEGAIVELRIRGQVGFNRLDVPVRRLKEDLEHRSKALIFLLKYEVMGTEYQSPIPQGETLSREALEEIVFGDLLAAHQDYGTATQPLARGLMHLKQTLLDDRPANPSPEHLESLYCQVERMVELLKEEG